MDVRSLRPLLLVLLASLTLISCGTQPVAPTAAPPPQDERAAAEAALARGDRQEAAALLEEAAARAQPPERQRLLLEAADLRLDLGQAGEASALLMRASGALLPPELNFHYRLLQARLLLANALPEAAASQLQTLQNPPEALREEWLRARAEILAASGQQLAAAQARAELDPLLEPIQAQPENRRALWELLSEAPMDALRLRMPPAPDQFGGWLELAYLVRSNRLNLKDLQEAVAQWQLRYPDHPASNTLVPELLAHYEENLRAPTHVAVLLPLTGELAGPARAILDGLTAAYYAASSRPELRVYDIGQPGKDVFSAYQEAVNAGADFVIGPLTKESLIALANDSSLPVPVLALNTLPPAYSAPSGLYQFALAPEDEADAAARYALARGYRSAVTLVPQGEWGQRVAQAFRSAFEAEGGRVLETGEYAAQEADFSDPIQQLFNLDASERRYRELRGALRRDIKFEPYRRQDLDVVFIGAAPREARLIRPQLRFFHALDLPVLATSHAYSGAVSPADQDLDGLEFMDMPWLLHPGTDPQLSRASLEPVQSSAAQFPRLYAFGIDAYRLIPYLQVLASAPGESLDGATGVLALDEAGRVHRRLFGARFVDGQVSTENLPQQPFGPLRHEPGAGQ